MGHSLQTLEFGNGEIIIITVSSQTYNVLFLNNELHTCIYKKKYMDCVSECTRRRYWVTQLCSHVLRTITITLSVLNTNSTVCYAPHGAYC